MQAKLAGVRTKSEGSADRLVALQNDPLLVATGGCGSGRQILTTGT